MALTTHPRARIGLIIPSVNTLTEPQFNHYAPEGVTIHVTRVRLELPEEEMLPAVRQAAELLADARCDVVVYHCTAQSMGRGLAGERELVAAVAEASGRPATSTATSVVEAFRALDIRRVVLVSPYAQALNDREAAYLGEVGVTVLRDVALALPVPEGMCGAVPDDWVRETLRAQHPEADGYFLSCTNIQSVGAISELEARLERPVVTSNQATLWHSLRLCGIDARIPELGRLFELSSAVPARA